MSYFICYTVFFCSGFCRLVLRCPLWYCTIDRVVSLSCFERTLFCTYQCTVIGTVVHHAHSHDCSTIALFLGRFGMSHDVEVCARRGKNHFTKAFCFIFPVTIFRIDCFIWNKIKSLTRLVVALTVTVNLTLTLTLITSFTGSFAVDNNSHNTNDNNNSNFCYCWYDLAVDTTSLSLAYLR